MNILDIKPLNFFKYFISSFLGILIFMIVTSFVSFYITYDGTNGMVLLKAYIWTVIGLFCLLCIKSLIVPLLYIFRIKIEKNEIIIKFQKIIGTQKIILKRGTLKVKIAPHKNKNLCLIITGVDTSKNKVNIKQCVISKWNNQLIRNIYNQLVIVATSEIGNGTD